MTGMELYVKFMFTLTFGLVGVGMVIMTLLETILADWDPVVDVRRWWRQLAQARSGIDDVRAEDILSELEGRRHGRHGRYAAPERPIDRRREVLRAAREADARVASPEPV